MERRGCAMQRYRIADLEVDMEPAYPLLKRQVQPYLREPMRPADMLLRITEQELDRRQRENPHLDRQTCEYFFLGCDFYTRLLDYEGCMLHASAVEVDGRAYLFSGPCGVGKSTHTALWRDVFGKRAVMLNDDKPAIRQWDDGLWVYGTPFSGKSDLNTNRRARMGGICMLEQGADNHIRSVRSDEAIPLLLQQTLRPAQPARMAALLERLDAILKSVPVYHLTCTISEEAARLAYETMADAAV